MSASPKAAFEHESTPFPEVELTGDDRKLLALVEPSLAEGKDLYAWWRKTDRANNYVNRFKLRRGPYDENPSVGFFDEAKLSSGAIPVLGVVQNLTWGRTSNPSANSQIREFALRYFMRVADFNRPASFSLRELAGRAADTSDPGGWGYSQIYYKLRAGRVGKFPTGARHKIVDLRELKPGGAYEWIVLRARLFNVEMNLSPLGDGGPQLVVPLARFTEEYLIASSEFIIDETNPEPGVAGRYGFGYATISDPAYENGPLLWGPGRFRPGFESFVFEVSECSDGVSEVSISSPFAVNRPPRIFGINPDPIALGIRAADFFSLGFASRLFPDLRDGIDPLLTPVSILNTTTGGLSSRFLGISVDNLERYFLVQHFMSAYDLLTGALLTYAQVPDWAAGESKLPFWVREGQVEE